MPAPDTLAATTLDLDGLRYTLTPDTRRRVVLDVRLTEPEDGGPLPYVDRVDLVSARARLAAAGAIADQLGRERREVVGHLVVLLDQAERAAAHAPAREVPELSEERRTRAAALLERPTLLDDAAAALTALGQVGEERTKRLGFLVAVSRLLAQPLSAILRAPSGSGKSRLLDALEALTPPEAVRYLSRLTGQALFYAEPGALAHKLVLIDEQAGASDADYSLRTLQSKGSLTLRAAGRGEVRVDGPIALMSGTTSSDLNPENLSRCLELCLDASPAQTKRIQAAQRAAAAGERPPRVERELWHDAQRLLEPRAVVIPYARQLSFPARTTHDRRGNQKLLGLIQSHALLHQRQRGRTRAGAVVAGRADYAAVYRLLAPLLADERADLSPRAADAYRWLCGAGRGTRRELQAALGCSYNTAKRALGELVSQELCARADAGPPAVWRVLDLSLVGAGAELVPPDALGGAE
ncbi:MAG: hypothetical protein AB7N76_02995 [Planctomycetota bacterium]